MKLDKEKLSEKELKKIKTEIEKKIEELKINYELNFFKNKSLEETKKIFDDLEIEESEQLATSIVKYFEINNRFEADNILDLFLNLNNKKKEKATDAIKILNTKFESLAQVKTEVLKKDLDFINVLLNYLYSNKIETNISTKEMEKILLESDLEEEEKYQLSIQIALIKIKTESKIREEEIDTFETTLENIIEEERIEEEPVLEQEQPVEEEIIQEENKNTEIIQGYLNRYKKMFKRNGLEANMKDLISFYENIETIKNEIASYTNIIDEAVYAMIISSLLEKMKTSNEEETKQILQLISEMNKKFENNYIHILTVAASEQNAIVQQIYMNSNSNVSTNEDTDKYWQTISEEQSHISKILSNLKGILITTEEFERINEEIKEIQQRINPTNSNSVMDKEPEKKEIKSFILFDIHKDHDNKTYVPYVVTDLDIKSTRNLIDKKIEKKKLKSKGYDEYSKLVKDLIMEGTPEYLMHDENSATNNDNRRVSAVYESTNSDKKTGMYRINPSAKSLVRFIEQKFTIKANTKALEQIEGIIHQYLPNISISHSENFEIYVNFASSFKVSDTDSYNAANNRYKNSYMKDNMEKISAKTELSDEDCNYLKEMVMTSINAYYELAKQNQDFDFNFIEGLGGKPMGKGD